MRPSIRTMLPGSRSGKEYASREPIFTYRKERVSLVLSEPSEPGPGLPGYFGERQAARRKDRANCAGRAGRRVPEGRGHGSPSARQKGGAASEKCELTLFADTAVVRNPRRAKVS